MDEQPELRAIAAATAADGHLLSDAAIGPESRVTEMIDGSDFVVHGVTGQGNTGLIRRRRMKRGPGGRALRCHF